VDSEGRCEIQIHFLQNSIAMSLCDEANKALRQATSSETHLDLASEEDSPLNYIRILSCRFAILSFTLVLGLDGAKYSPTLEE
jgi:hypothetical protein